MVRLLPHALFSINHSVNRAVNQTIKASISKPSSKPNNKTINQSVNQSNMQTETDDPPARWIVQPSTVTVPAQALSIDLPYVNLSDKDTRLMSTTGGNEQPEEVCILEADSDIFASCNDNGHRLGIRTEDGTPRMFDMKDSVSVTEEQWVASKGNGYIGDVGTAVGEVKDGIVAYQMDLGHLPEDVVDRADDLRKDVVSAADEFLDDAGLVVKYTIKDAKFAAESLVDAAKHLQQGAETVGREIEHAVTDTAGHVVHTIHNVAEKTEEIVDLVGVIFSDIGSGISSLWR